MYTETLLKMLMLTFWRLFGLFDVQIPESDASILSITIDREASYMAAVNNQVSKNINAHCESNIITVLTMINNIAKGYVANRSKQKATLQCTIKLFCQLNTWVQVCTNL